MARTGRNKTQEVEIKLRVPSARHGRKLIEGARFVLSRPRVFEANTVYDTAALDFRTRGALVRLRTAGPETVLTYKGPAEPGRHKSREEIEFLASDTGAAAAFLERLNLAPVFRYEKYRTEFRKPRSPGVVTLDETPLGVFLELEGPPEWIDRTARLLGFSESDYMTASYGRLYFDHCARLGIAPGDMVFERSRPKSG